MNLKPRPNLQRCRDLPSHFKSGGFNYLDHPSVIHACPRSAMSAEFQNCEVVTSCTPKVKYRSHDNKEFNALTMRFDCVCTSTRLR